MTIRDDGPGMPPAGGRCRRPPRREPGDKRADEGHRGFGRCQQLPWYRDRGPIAGAAMRVMIVDDHPMWRDSVARDLAEAGFEVVATVGEGAQALRIAASVQPDVVVLDLQLPDVSGVEVTRGLLAAHPGVRVLILSASGEQHDVLDAVKAGATGYLVKSASQAELIDAVKRTESGDAVFSPGLAGLVLGEFRRLAVSPDPDTPRLTDREAEILRMVGTGLTYRQIAERLVLSHRTVQNHVQNTLSKLQLHNRGSDPLCHRAWLGLPAGPGFPARLTPGRWTPATAARTTRPRRADESPPGGLAPAELREGAPALRRGQSGMERARVPVKAASRRRPAAISGSSSRVQRGPAGTGPAPGAVRAVLLMRRHRPGQGPGCTW